MVVHPALKLLGCATLEHETLYKVCKYKIKYTSVLIKNPFFTFVKTGRTYTDEYIKIQYYYWSRCNNTFPLLIFLFYERI